MYWSFCFRNLLLSNIYLRQAYLTCLHFIVFHKLTKSMTDMRGSSNFRLRGGWGGGGGAGQNLTEKGFVNFLVLKLIYSGFNVLYLFTVGSTVNSKRKLYFLVPKGVQHFPRVGVELNCLFSIKLAIFKVSPDHLLPPPPPPFWVRA